VRLGSGDHRKEVPMPPPYHPFRIYWEPDHESRSSAWKRLKHQLAQELDAIEARFLLRRRLDRSRLHPTYPRNQDIYQRHRAGESDRDLGRRFRLKTNRIREIVRMMHLHHRLAEQVGPPPRGQFRLGSSRQLDADKPHLSPTAAVLRDP
jgi:hypothetical protein